MAILNPELEVIRQLNPHPTAGELHLLNFLLQTLDDTFEIYFQPFLNGDMPDIIVMRQNSGVYIFEVKDWDLIHYEVINNEEWEVTDSKGNRGKITSPNAQVKKYKDNLFELHIPGLLEKSFFDKKVYSIISCGLYFHNCTTSRLEDLYNNSKIDHTHIDLLGHDYLEKQCFIDMFEKRYMTKTSKYFNMNLYNDFRRHLSPPTHVTEDGIDIKYLKEQKRIIESKSGSMQKIKGVAGSGKTLCLAKRAVNSHKRHHNDVLILTYNISLRNYIHDKISEVRENFQWKHFHILHYHEFIKNTANNFSIKLDIKNGDYENKFIFEKVKKQVKKYDTIIIDEIQDYKEPWIHLILNYFLKDDGEYVVFGDEKQNIYHNDYDQLERKPYTKIPGQWNLLKRSHRATKEIAHLSEVFQTTFFSHKYEIDNIIITNENDKLKSNFLYFYVTTPNIKEIIRTYKEFSKKNMIHENDICFLSAHVDFLRELDYAIRQDSPQKTNTMFETQEVFQKISMENSDKKIINMELSRIRRGKKFNFWANAGTLKLSTTHSFKGWEVDTLILIITNDKELESNNTSSTAELIYTSITRCRKNLIIYNIGNNTYHDFFSKNMVQSLVH